MKNFALLAAMLLALALAVNCCSSYNMWDMMAEEDEDVDQAQCLPQIFETNYTHFMLAEKKGGLSFHGRFHYDYANKMMKVSVRKWRKEHHKKFDMDDMEDTDDMLDKKRKFKLHDMDILYRYDQSKVYLVRKDEKERVKDCKVMKAKKEMHSPCLDNATLFERITVGATLNANVWHVKKEEKNWKGHSLIALDSKGNYLVAKDSFVKIDRKKFKDDEINKKKKKKHIKAHMHSDFFDFKEGISRGDIFEIPDECNKKRVEEIAPDEFDMDMLLPF